MSGMVTPTRTRRPKSPLNKKLRGRDGTNISEIAISAASADRISAVADEIAAVLREEHDLEPGKDDDFMVRTQEDMTSMRTQTTETMTGLLAAIASVLAARRSALAS